MKKNFSNYSKTPKNLSSIFNIKKNPEISPIKEKKYIKFKVNGLKQQISYNEYQYIKSLDKKKLLSVRDNIKYKIKINENDYENKLTIYKPKIMNRISSEREKELRTTIYHMSDALQNRKKDLKKESEELYYEILKNIKLIFNKIIGDLDGKINDTKKRLNLRIEDCNYHFEKNLKSKIEEQEIILLNLHRFTHEMKKVKYNYEIIVKKVHDCIEKNFELENKIKIEINKQNQLNVLMKEYKNRMNKMIKIINKFKKNKNSLNNKQIKIEYLSNSYSNNKIHKRNHTSTDVLKIFNKNNDILNTDFTYFNNNVNRNKFNSNSYRSNSNNKIKNNNEIIINNFKYQDELFSSKLLEKKNRYYKFKKHFYQSLLYNEIPNNKIYNILLNLIEIKTNEFNSKNNIKNNNMNIIPFHSKYFRNEFMEMFFKNKELLNAINIGEKSHLNKIFNKRLFSK